MSIPSSKPDQNPEVEELSLQLAQIIAVYVSKLKKAGVKTRQGDTFGYDIILPHLSVLVTLKNGERVVIPRQFSILYPETEEEQYK